MVSKEWNLQIFVNLPVTSKSKCITCKAKPLGLQYLCVSYVAISNRTPDRAHVIHYRVEKLLLRQHTLFSGYQASAFSTVMRLWSESQRNCVLITNNGKRFFSQASRLALGPPSLIFNGSGRSVFTGKVDGCQINHVPHLVLKIQIFWDVMPCKLIRVANFSNNHTVIFSVKNFDCLTLMILQNIVHYLSVHIV